MERQKIYYILPTTILDILYIFAHSTFPRIFIIFNRNIIRNTVFIKAKNYIKYKFSVKRIL